MKSKKYIEFVASFLIVLVLTLPFYTANVYASINSISAKGSDGIEGYIKANDFINFIANVFLENDNITNNQVVLGSYGQFDSCAPSISSGFDCTIRVPSSGTSPFEVKSVPFTINLLKDDGATNDTKSSNITVDNKAPEVKLSSAPKFSSQQNIIINYNVTDFACDDPSCNNKCVGIKNIDFYTQDNSFKQTITATGCNAVSSISIDPKTFSDGLNSVFAKATDKFNQESAEKSVTFTLDSSAPLVLPESLVVVRKGISLNAFSSKGIDAEVSINISGSDLNPNSVIADLSSLNPSANLTNVKGTCSFVQSDLATCKWNILLKPNTEGLKNIFINTSDISGNKDRFTLGKFLSLDDNGPVVESLSTTAAINGQVLGASTGNTVIALFNEATGLANDEAVLHVGDFLEIKATKCLKDLSWTCTWENVDFGSSTQIAIEADTTDVLGNSVSSSNFVSVTLDNDAPQLKSINMSPVGGIVPAFEGFFKIGDKIAVVANVTEDFDVFAVADFSKFISGASKVQGFCQRLQADEHVCEWLTGAINIENTDVVTFNFSDNAGNTLIVTRSLKTFGLENATTPDFWSSTVECSPKSIDRSIGPLINQRVFCNVLLTPKSTTKETSTVFISQPTCSGDTSIVEDVETFNTEAESTSPIIKITLKRDDFNIDKAQLTCSFDIFSKIGSGTDITSNPEIENAVIDMQFFNLPLGELSSEVEEKIKQAKDDAQGILEQIGSLNKYVNIAKKICQLFSAIYNAVAVLYTVTLLLSNMEDACKEIPFLGFLGPVCPIIYASKNKACLTEQTARKGSEDAYKTIGHQFCKRVNCEITGIDALDKWKSYLTQKINNLPAGAYFPGVSTEFRPGLEGKQELIVNGIEGGLSAYLNPQTNLIVATAFICLPGIVYSLDKYRQVLCLYADCLENGVAKDGLPVTACEDQKKYAQCKYVTGELFAIIPYTAALDYILGLVKNAFSNPFELIGVALSGYCWYECPKPGPTSSLSFTICESVKLLSTMGVVLENVRSIIYEGFRVRQDYCSRVGL